MAVGSPLADGRAVSNELGPTEVGMRPRKLGHRLCFVAVHGVLLHIEGFLIQLPG